MNKALVRNEEESKNDTSEFCLLGNSDKLSKHLEQVCLAKYDSNIPVGQKHWFIDSGCTAHMTFDRDAFKTYT